MPKHGAIIAYRGRGVKVPLLSRFIPQGNRVYELNLMALFRICSFCSIEWEGYCEWWIEKVWEEVVEACYKELSHY